MWPRTEKILTSLSPARKKLKELFLINQVVFCKLPYSSQNTQAAVE